MAFLGQVFNDQNEGILGSEDILASSHNFIIKFYGKDSPSEARYEFRLGTLRTGRDTLWLVLG